MQCNYKEWDQIHRNERTEIVRHVGSSDFVLSKLDSDTDARFLLMPNNFNSIFIIMSILFCQVL